MADQDTYDKLAKILKDIQERFPDDAFSKYQRLKGLLSDHLPEAEREIRIVLDAVDEGLVGVLTDTPKSELGMQIDRLVLRLETSRGIREDIARQVVQAFAYALGLGGLPSSVVSQPTPPPIVPTDAGGDDWVGVSEVASTPQTSDPQIATKEPATAETSVIEKLTTGKNRNILIGVVVAVVAFSWLSQPTSEPPQGGMQNPPRLGSQPPQPGQQNPQQNPQNPPTRYPQQPNQQPQQQGNAGSATWYDDYGSVWQINYANYEFQGQASYNGSPVYMLGRYDDQGAIQYAVYDSSRNQIAQGQGQLSDQTHISFITYDMIGNVVGQGQFHVNHMPR